MATICQDIQKWIHFCSLQCLSVALPWSRVHQYTIAKMLQKKRLACWYKDLRILYCFLLLISPPLFPTNGKQRLARQIKIISSKAIIIITFLLLLQFLSQQPWEDNFNRKNLAEKEVSLLIYKSLDVSSYTLSLLCCSW